MSECRDCELAVFCYVDRSQWIFRTQEQMQEIERRLAGCPLHRLRKPQAAAENTAKRPVPRARSE